MDYIRVMLPLMFVNALWGLNNAAQNAILEHMAARAIAANSVASTLFLLVKSTAQGSAATASFFTGKTIGEGALDRLRVYARTWQVLFVLIGIWCIVLPISWAAAFVYHASPITVVWCLNADQIFKAVPAFWKCNFGHWARELTRS